MAILFDKCNVSVFLDISKSMMVLHNLLKAIREQNDHILYHKYSMDFYKSVYSVRIISLIHPKSPEVKLLLLLQSSNKQSFTTSQFLTVPGGSCSIHSSRESGVENSCDMDLPLFDALSHSNHYYNNSLSIIYTQYNALDLMYEATIDSTIRKKELSHSDEKTLPSEWVTDPIKRVTSLMEDRSTLQEERSSPYTDTKFNPSSPPSNIVSNNPIPNEYNSIRNANYFVNRNVEGFTLPQAIQFLLEKSAYSSIP